MIADLFLYLVWGSVMAGIMLADLLTSRMHRSDPRKTPPVTLDLTGTGSGVGDKRNHRPQPRN